LIQIRSIQFIGFPAQPSADFRVIPLELDFWVPFLPCQVPEATQWVATTGVSLLVSGYGCLMASQYTIPSLLLIMLNIHLLQNGFLVLVM